MGEGHAHGSAVSAAHSGRRYKTRLLYSFVVVALYFVVELVGGLLANSLALLSDAGHMFTDVLGLGMAAAAIHAADQAASDPQKTFGSYRLEVLAALANAILLFGVALYVLYEAFRRLSDPPEVLGVPMLIVAAIGLLVNVVVFFLLRNGASESLNVEGAYLEVLADMLGSIGVIAAAIIVQTTGFWLVDPIFGVIIGVFVLPRTWRLGRKAIKILMQVAPERLNVASIRSALAGIPGVIEVHDLHLWTLTSGFDVCSAHLRVRQDADPSATLRAAKELLGSHYNLRHTTIQIEVEGLEECAPGECETAKPGETFQR